MTRFFRRALPVLGLAFVLPVAAADDKKPDLEKEKKAAIEKFVTSGQQAGFQGKILNFDPSEKVMIILAKLQVPELDANVARNIENKQVRLAQELAKARPDRNTVFNLQREIAQEQTKLIKYKPVDQKFQVPVHEKVRVRWQELPTKYDDKGFVVKRTKEEIQELKGTDSKVPGYRAELGDVKANMQATVYLAKAAGGAKGDSGDKGGEKDAPIVLEKSTVTTILLTPETPKP